MVCGIVDWAEQFLEEYDVQNLAYTVVTLQFPKTLNRFIFIGPCIMLIVE